MFILRQVGNNKHSEYKRYIYPIIYNRQHNCLKWLSTFSANYFKIIVNKYINQSFREHG